MAKRTIVINHGKIIFDDTTEKLKKDYIKTKIIELIVDEPIEKFEFAGGEVKEKTRFSLKVELDTAKNSIDKLLSYAVENFAIKDINIFDPEMEEIIADIYRDKKI